MKHTVRTELKRVGRAEQQLSNTNKGSKKVRPQHLGRSTIYTGDDHDDQPAPEDAADRIGNTDIKGHSNVFVCMLSQPVWNIGAIQRLIKQSRPESQGGHL